MSAVPVSLRWDFSRGAARGIMQGEIGLRFFVLLEGEADVYISGSEGDDRMPVCAFSLLVWASRCTRPPLPAACTA